MKGSVRMGKRGLPLLAVLFLVSVWLAPYGYASTKPPDWASIQQRMQKLIRFLDSPQYADLVPWDEHIVLVYTLTRGQQPGPVEFFLLRGLRDDIGIKRSTLLSIALRGKGPRNTWTQCRAFLNQVKVSDFRVDSEVRKIARRLSAIPRSEMTEALKRTAENARIDRHRRQPPFTRSAPGVRYQTFFGYLHAHSNLSDGKGDPIEAYTHAYVQGELDFFALTDHGEQLDNWPWESEWEALTNAAEALYVPGTFVTLWGFEWSNPFLGHINVLNTADYTDAISTFWITRLYDWLRNRPEGFGRFVHPGEYDWLDSEFLHLELYPDSVQQMVGIETWNGNNSFDHYYYKGGWESGYSYWDEGNRQEWYLGALGGQDNHSRNWGTLNEFRVAVLAEGLTREHIVDAYLSRRFYATEDKDLYLDVRCQGYPMGSRLSGVRRRFVVKARDGSGDTFRRVRLYRNGKLLETKIVSGN